MFIDALKNNKEFKLENCIVDGDITFDNIIKKLKENNLEHLISNDGYVYNIQHKLTFINIIFNGKISFSLPTIIFNKSVIFLSSTFNGRVRFLCLFKGDVRFNRSSFYEIASFSGSKFEKDADFSCSTFWKDVRFEASMFNKRLTFEYSKFKCGIKLRNSVFMGEVNFRYSEFENIADFWDLGFEEDVDFSNIRVFGAMVFKNIKFKSIVKFTDISFDFLILSECLFKDMAIFKKINPCKGLAIFHLVNFGESENTVLIDFPLSKTSFLLTDVRDITIIADAEKILDEVLLEIMNYVNYIKGTFKYDRNTNKELLELLKEELQKRNIIFENENICKLFLEMLINDKSIYYYITAFPYLRLETVLKEYGNIRKSFEKYRTFIEASELFIYEMDLIRKTILPNYEEFRNLMLKYDVHKMLMFLLALFIFGLVSNAYPLIVFVLILTVVVTLTILYDTKGSVLKYLTYPKEFLEGLAFDVYKAVSNYGESLVKPIIITIFVILIIPCIITHSWNPFSDSGKILLEQTLRAFFQLGINNEVINSATNPIQKEQLQTLASYEWLIRIISLILLGNIFIAIKRRLERK